jgi:WD40 repeat protein
MQSREFGQEITNTYEVKPTLFSKPTSMTAKIAQFDSLKPNGNFKIADSEVFACAYNRTGKLLATSLQNGSLQIVDPAKKILYYEVHDDAMQFPITGLAWRPLNFFQPEATTPHTMLGSCCDGTVLRWTEYKPEVVEHIKLSEGCEYRCVNYCYTGRRFVVAGSKGSIEVYDEDRLKMINQFPKEKMH